MNTTNTNNTENNMISSASSAEILSGNNKGQGSDSQDQTQSKLLECLAKLDAVLAGQARIEGTLQALGIDTLGRRINA